MGFEDEIGGNDLHGAQFNEVEFNKAAAVLRVLDSKLAKIQGELNNFPFPMNSEAMELYVRFEREKKSIEEIRAELLRQFPSLSQG